MSDPAAPVPPEEKPPISESQPGEGSAGGKDKAGSPKAEMQSKQPSKAEGQDGLDKLTSPEKLRQATSEARDQVAVMRQFVPGAHQGMFVERDTHVHGDLVMQFGQSAGSERPQGTRAVNIPGDEIRRVRSVYQRPEAYHKCHDRLRACRLVVVLGQAHIGKRSAAVRLALDVLGDQDPRILEFDCDISMEDLQNVSWQSQTAYLVDGLSAERFRNLLRTTLRGLAQAVEKAESYLIVCADPNARPHEDVTREFCVELGPPCSNISILLERHLSFYAGNEFSLSEIQALLQKPELEQLLQQPISPQGVDDLSQRLLRVLRGEWDLAQALKGFILAVESQVQAWFDEAGDDVEERAFRLALAAFNGARYMAVQAAAQDLARRLVPPQPPDKDKPPPPPPSPFARRLSSRLERARAHLEWAPEPGSSIPGSRIEVVQLDDPAYPAALLRHVWCEYSDLRGKLLDWLSDYAAGHTAEMRTRAAVAVGALATYDLATIRNQILIPWIRRQEAQYRAAIGKALGVLVWSDEHSASVLALLKDWSERQDQAFRWAAARAYAEVGLRYPHQAMEQWQAVLLSSEDEIDLGLTDDMRLVLYNPLRMSILDTMLGFFITAVELPDRYRSVYEESAAALKSWCDQDRKERREKHGTALGLPIFLVLAAVHVEEPSTESEPDTWPPAMLVLVSAEPAPSPYRATVAGLFRQTLRWRPTQEWARQTLEDWLKRADHDARLEPSLIALLRDLAFDPEATDRDRGQLTVYLRRWASHPRHPSRTAGHAREQLSL